MKKLIAVKKIRKVEILEVLKERRCVETWINGQFETQKWAEAGEYLVKGSQGEEYCIDPETMEKRYNIEDGYAITKPVEIDFDYAEEDMTIIASWGSEMRMHKGDALVYEDGKLSYGIARNAFEETYEVKE